MIVLITLFNFYNDFLLFPSRIYKVIFAGQSRITLDIIKVCLMQCQTMFKKTQTERHFYNIMTGYAPCINR